MKFDFSRYPISNRAYSERPMGFVEPGAAAMLGAVSELAMIETGSRAARERWQKTQLRNLLAHAKQRSGFWRARLGPRPPDAKLGTLPILSRPDVVKQVAQEGSLLRPADGLQVTKQATSGSSGVAVHFFASQMNAQYNGARYLAQNFIEGKDLSLPRTRITTAKGETTAKVANTSSGFTVEKNASWLGGLEALFSSGPRKWIETFNPDLRGLVRELRKDPVGCLLINPRMVSAIVSHSGVATLRELGVSELHYFGESLDPALHREITAAGIPVSSNYSSEEAGPIAFECGSIAGYYHVATSNVIVEVVDVAHELDGRKLGRVLATALHSYATPFIRYELGDLALLAERCPCGHDGPALHSLHGRTTNALLRSDGTMSAFLIRGAELAKVVEFTEFRIRQVEPDRIVAEFGGRETLTPEETDAVTAFLQLRAGQDFRIEVIPRHTIDWGGNVKRQAFRREL
jgi:phenylacetate-coenzyme A ligase PaaK-like adenylate-forming protein